MPPRKKKRKTSQSKKRRATVFDAVQGGVNASGLIKNLKGSNATRRPLRPDEVLFKRKKAPVRYQEDDDYAANTKLPPDQQLPRPELTSAIHAYMSHLFASFNGLHKQALSKSMDGTALIAMGILMEETARSILGETGDLAFTEADQEKKDEIRRRQREWTMSTRDQQAESGDENEGSGSEMEHRAGKTIVGPSANDWTWSDENSAHTSDDTDYTVDMD